MKFLGFILSVLLLFGIQLTANQPIPYSGKISIRGVNYDGDAKFTYSLVDKDGKVYWRNGSKAGETIKVNVRNGFYTVLLGGQGMNILPPQLFLDNEELYLKVHFDNGDGQGLRHLEPDQRITATPRALVAEVAKVAKVAELVKDGVITRNMLSVDVLAKLDANQTASAISDGTITRNMLHANILSDLNQPTPASGSIKLSMLDSEVTAKLDHNGSGANGVVAGSLISVPYGQPAPAGYSLYKGGNPKNISWEKLREASSDLNVSLSVSSTIQNEIFMTRGSPPSTQILKFNPVSNEVVKNINMQTPRYFASTANFNDHFYVIGGYDGNTNLSSVEIYNPITNQWSFGPILPLSDRGGHSIVFNNDLYYFSGIGGKGIYKLDGQSNSWTFESNMTSTKWNFDLITYENKIWILGGRTFGSGGGYPKVSEVEIYDPLLKTIVTGVDMIFPREGLDSWVANNLLFAAGGGPAEAGFSIEVYDPLNSSWELVGDLPTKGGVIEIVGNYIYTVKGELPDENATDYIYRHNLELFDLYRKDGNASIGTPLVQAEVVNGSVTSNKIATGAVTASKIANNTITIDQLNDQILKYLKPEITTQPQAQTVYADNNVSYSVTAEGKYLSYQWKKDGSNLAGETNATINITDANATQHDGNYSVVVSNDFGSVESGEILVDVNTTWSTEGLVGWWKFDEVSGTVAYDSSGNGHDGNLTNGPTWTSGKIGGALRFDGSNDRVKLPHDILNGQIEVTVSFWFLESQNNTNHHHFISAASSTESNRFLLAVNSNGEFNYNDNDSSDIKRIAYQYSESLTNWSHIVLTRSISGAKLFLEGSLKANESFANTHFNIAQNGLWIGGDQDSVGGGWSTTQQLNGLLDDVRIYERALSVAEVQALYNLGQ